MPSTLRDLSELTAVANDDQLLVSDTSDVINRDKKISRLNLLGSNISGGGSIATGGNSLTIPASGSAVVGTGTAGRISQWSSVNEVAASTLLKSGAGLLSLSAAATATLTVPGTGTAALLEMGQTYAGANTFTAQQTFNGGVIASVFLTTQITINAGSVVTLPAPFGGAVILTARASGLNLGSFMGIFYASGSRFMNTVYAGSDVETSLSVLTGSTGTAGKVTVSVTNASGPPLLYIENRTAAARIYNVFILGG